MEKEVGIWNSTRTWGVNAPEGPYHGKHGHPASYTICKEDPHCCIALVFGETDEEARSRALFIMAAVQDFAKRLV